MLAGNALKSFLRSCVTGEESDEATTGAVLLGEFLINQRLLAFGKQRKR